MSPLLILTGICIIIFAILMIFGAHGQKGRIFSSPGNGIGTVIAGLTSINITGALGLGWFVVEMLSFEGVMIVELLICAFLIAILALMTGGAFALKRRGMIKAAVALLALAALPTIAAYGFLLYFDSHPIDMR